MNPLLVRSCAFGTGHEKICVPLMAPDTPSLRQQAKAAIHAGCDLVEWRVDAMKDGLAIDVMRPALRALREEVGEKTHFIYVPHERRGGPCARLVGGIRSAVPGRRGGTRRRRFIRFGSKPGRRAGDGPDAGNETKGRACGHELPRFS